MLLVSVSLCWSLVLVLSFSSHFLSDFHVDRAALDERPDDSDRHGFTFQMVDLPTEEGAGPSDIVTVESDVVRESGTDSEAGYVLAESSGDLGEHAASAPDDWYLLSSTSTAATSDRRRPPPEGIELATEGADQTPQLQEYIEKDFRMFSSDLASTSDDICLPFDTTAVPEDLCELPPQFAEATYSDELYAATPVSPPTASDAIPSTASSSISFLHAVGAGVPTSRLRSGETSTLPAMETEQITSSALMTSPPMFLAATEECRSSDQQLSLSVCEPIYAYPDVVCLEPSFSPERPIVSERELTHGGDHEEQRVPFGPEFPSSRHATEEIRQPDGTVVRRRVVRTSVRRVATRRVRRRQPDGSVVEYTETMELPAEDIASADGQPSELDLRAATSDTDTVPGAVAGRVVGVYTDTDRSGEPQVDTDVEVVRETLPDGRVVERRIVRTRQRRTVVKRVVVRPDHPDRS